MEIAQKEKLANIIVNGIFLITLNLVLMSIIGYLTLDSEANMNSRFGALIVSFLLPFFIVFLTQKLRGLQRFLLFGFGFITYIAIAISAVGFPHAFLSGLFPCLMIALGVLYYGDSFLKTFRAIR